MQGQREGRNTYVQGVSDGTGANKNATHISSSSDTTLTSLASFAQTHSGPKLYLYQN
jgi:hypothetical protein